MTDLFDVLDIGTREDSYTSLLAALFDEKPKWAREFFRRSRDAKDLPPKPVGVHRWPRTSVSGKTAIPDLVVTFGDPATVVWVVEAKIEAREGGEQLAARESDEARKGLTESLELPEAADWHYSHLTLEGEQPSGARRFQPASYEPLTEIFTKKPSLSEGVHPAYETLRKRLRAYYKARHRKPDPESTVGGYLGDTGGLISERSRFYWLGRRVAEDLKLAPAFGVAQGRGNASPFCQMRDSGWRGPPYTRASETPLEDCHDIHLELQLDQDSARLLLHYETNPFMPRLKSLPGNVTNKQYDEYRERRKRFAQALAQRGEALGEAGWGLTSPGGVNQLARLQMPLALDMNIDDFRKRVHESTKAMRSAVNDSLDES